VIRRTIPGTIETRFRVWALAMFALLAVFALRVAPQLRVETSILALLPADPRDGDIDQALYSYSELLGRNSLFLIGADNTASTDKSAVAFAAALRASGVFSQVRLEVGSELIQAARANLPYRDYLLAPRHRAWLESGDLERLYAEAQRALYTPAGWMRPFNAAEDPLGLLSAFVTAQRPPIGRAQLQDGMLAVSENGRRYVLVTAQTRASPFAVATQEAGGAAIAAARAAATAAGASEIVASGVLQHAVAASRSARAEMSLYSTLSMIGSVLLLIWVFRSAQPLLLTALSMGLGAIAGLCVCQWAFGRVHLVTLVFGSSLIGTSVDYSIYFFADRFRDPEHWDPVAAPAFVTPGIALGYLTTALSYLALLLAPFPGLREIALFSAVGLGVACGCVLFLNPRLTRRWPLAAGAVPLRIGDFLDRLRLPASRRLRLALGLLLILIVAGGLPRVHFIDDVRSFQSSPPELIHAEARARELLGQSVDRRFLLVRGATLEQVLQREEALRVHLAPLLADRRLGNLIALSSALPSQQTQAANRRLLAEKVYAQDGLLPRFMRDLGYPDAVIARELAGFDSRSASLQPDAFFAGALAEPYRALYLGRVGNGEATAVALFDVRDAGALEQAVAQVPGVRLVDKLSDISELLGSYRRIALMLIAGTYVLIGIVLSLRYGFAGAIAALMPVIGGGALCIALLGWAGVPLNLFHVLGLLLVLGMGSDYTIFLRESRGAVAPALLAVVLATLTAVLSFGLLAFSSIPFIRAIGLVQALGVTLAVVMAIGLRPHAQDGVGSAGGGRQGSLR